MFEVLFEVFGELFLQFFVEVLLELGLQSLAAPFRRKPNPWLAAVGYCLFGALAGGLSLVPFPKHFTPAGFFRVLNLILTPLAVGGLMAAIGAWRAKRGQPVLRIDRFFYGFLFAAAVAAIRFQFAG